MKYIVTVAGRELEVDVDGERVTVAGQSRTASLRAIPGTPLRQLVVDGRPSTLAVQGEGRGLWTIDLRGERWELEAVDERTRHIRGLTGGGGHQRGPVVLRAPMPGLVVRVMAEPGQRVAAGGGVVVLEAMKMENELEAAVEVVVKAVRVRAGEAVEKGQVLVEYE